VHLNWRGIMTFEKALCRCWLLLGDFGERMKEFYHAEEFQHSASHRGE
jgi:hypothetical protein